MLVVKVSVVKPLPLPLVTSAQATEATAVVVSDATCHLIVRVSGDGAETVVKEKVLVRPAVVVSLDGCTEILVILNMTSLVADA